MNRWHEVSCVKPDVQVLPDGTIRCFSCHQTPHTTQLIAERATVSSVPLVPPDKPLGQLKLWWPRSVPYLVSTPPASDDAGIGQHEMDLDQPSEAALMSGPYPSTLGQSELRLICIEAAPSPDYPLHLSLEVYDLDNCPEYEAVSYTWAGEDGDSTLSKPIYVGPFWDCLVQTNNCWEMLRFVRPWRGIRMLWVDAICINQNNIPERSSQVANMDRIYSSCSRVVVYLGPDLATSLHGRYARRGRLHELETGVIKPAFPAQTQQPQPYRLEDLLSRRYFSRIWVVQELLLSKGAVIRVGDVDFWADASMSSRLSSSMPTWTWGQTHAAWARYISQGASSIGDLKELLQTTALSLATDPRDRLFGLLGIMPELSVLSDPPTSDSHTHPLQLGGLQADYTLSCQHIFIGLFGYCILNLQRPDVLYHASSASPVPGYPSWVPNWTSPETWRLLFQSPKTDDERILSLVRRRVPPDTMNLSDASESEDDEDPVRHHDLEGPAHAYIQAERRWNQNASIDTSTGALSINLTHCMPLSETPEKVEEADGFFLFYLDAEPCGLYLVSEHRLDKLITGSDNDQLFILDAGDDCRVYLILRPRNLTNTFKLVAVCPYIVIKTRWGGYPEIGLSNLQYSLYDALPEVQPKLDQELDLEEEFAPLCSGVKSYRDLLPTLVKRHREGPGDVWELASAIYDACVERIDPRFLPRISDDGHVEITISSLDKEFPIYTRRIINHDHGPDFRYRIKGEEEWRDVPLSLTTYNNMVQAGEQWIDVQFAEITDPRYFRPDAHQISKSLFRDLDRFAQVSKHTGEDILSMLTRDRTDEDKFVGCESAFFHDLFWQDGPWDKLQLVGSTFMVHIE
ncbi:uncharacterized protein NECHADRAFT_87806 [Fusarium vanettenii 77-13-4]|uniref:Heterokaryon incompatibility domain-containing protein n=1 Tax=Fusarium vanettenii (strain ATCC MYA-4622 / CBS 123669 / FGSC 9596 / NRRL 45880 / 77-13-4) TaxID=660122 RepID=C7Z330_FUSV7|nr:uncharacterized protein NECHADRAFT_87806 [Fusarium vanettenii 77-13-4]EEU41760.1 hypothetical protein NECHADRAFT_87806 [Fusarium vanettenii 77-13-4]